MPHVSLSQEDLLEEKTATHSRILAREIPWTNEPGGLQSMGSQRVGHDLAAEHMLMHYQCILKNNYYISETLSRMIPLNTIRVTCFIEEATLHGS